MSDVVAMEERKAAWNTMSEVDAEKTLKVVDTLRALLPQPAGYRMLIAIPVLKAHTAGGIAKPDDLLERERLATVIGYVVALGKDAYSDAAKFPNGPWCTEGDWVIFRNYSGTRFMIGGFEFRTVNDDAIDAVTNDPTGISRVG